MYSFVELIDLHSFSLIRKILFRVLLVLIIIPVGCKKDTSLHTTWLAGEIINPTTRHIIISQGDQIIDSIQLDSNNFFWYKSETLKEGLYMLRHNETQVFYVEPGDSLMLHLNTIEFDESLAYSGRGAHKNNLLMEYFLINEQENINLPKWYPLSNADFTAKIDSLRDLKEIKYQDFLSNQTVPNGFHEAVRASIDYDYYMKKELYALANISRIDSFDTDFFDYRKELDLNNENLRFYYPYFRFLMYFMDNQAAEKMESTQNRFSAEFSNYRLDAIEKLVTNDSIKNNLARNTALRFYFNGKGSEEELQKFHENYKAISSHQKHLKEVQKISETAIRMTPGKTIKNIPLLTFENTTVGLHDLISKPTVLFFWSYKAPTQSNSNHKKAAELREKYPEYSFLGINTDNHFRQWKSYITNQNYNVEKEFQLENEIDSEHALLLNNLSKAIILNKNLKILDGNTSMFHQNFEELLLGFLNRTDD